MRWKRRARLWVLPHRLLIRLVTVQTKMGLRRRKRRRGANVEVEMIKQFDYHYVILDDHKESPAGVLNALCDKGISLLAFSSFPYLKGKTQLDLVPEDASALARVLEGMGLRVSARKSGFLVRTEAGPCAVREVLDK